MFFRCLTVLLLMLVAVQSTQAMAARSLNDPADVHLDAPTDNGDWSCTLPRVADLLSPATGGCADCQCGDCCFHPCQGMVGLTILLDGKSPLYSDPAPALVDAPLVRLLRPPTHFV